MKTALLNVGHLPPALLARLAGHYSLTTLAEQPDPAAFLATRGAEFEAVVTSAAVGAAAALITALPSLRVISSFGVGLDKIDVAAAHARGIPVGYTPDVLNDCVADTAFGLLIDVARGFSAADRFVRRGGWLQGPAPLGRKVSGARLGLVGMGRIGRAIAQRSIGFEMAVRYHTRRVVADVPWAHEASLVELARWADFLVIITAGGVGTRQLVNAEVLDARAPRVSSSTSRAVRWSTKTRWWRRCSSAASPAPGWTSTPTNRRCRRRCWRWTRWCCCRTSPARPTRRGRRWPTVCSTTCKATLPKGGCFPRRPRTEGDPP